MPIQGYTYTCASCQERIYPIKTSKGDRAIVKRWKHYNTTITNHAAIL